MEKYTVDRIEGNTVVLLKKGNESIAKDMPLSAFPAQLKEGDIVNEIATGDKISYNILVEETKMQQDKAISLLEKLKNK